jgi:hypothetical protein
LKKEKRNLILNLVKAKIMSDKWNKKQVDLFALGVVSGLVSFSQFVVQTPALAYSVKVGTVPFIKKFKENPIRQIKSGYAISKNLIKSIAKKGYAIGKIAILNPGYALGLIAGELVILEASGGAWKIVGKASGGLTRQISKSLNPYFRKIENGKIVLRKVPEEIFEVYDKKRFLESRVKAPSFKRPFSSLSDLISRRKPGQFKRFAKDAGLVLKEQTVSSGATKLSRQARLAGRTVTAVNASAEQLTSLLRRKKIIRKPIPGQESFPIKIRQLLSKFDSGKKLSNKEFANVNSWLRKNVAPNITLLERSLYLDPASGLRTSRLGIQPTKYATIRDILRGNFRLWASAGKPQVLIFENAKVANFPKSLQSIKRKLLADKPLTMAETNKLIRWQVQTGSGKFKPIGSTIYAGGKELEVTLAPGEMIKRIKRVGFTYIQGKKVNFVTAEIFKPSKAILSAIKKANMGKLSKSQITSLEKLLSKKLGRKIKVETPELRKSFIRRANRADQNIPVLRIRGRGVFVSKLFRGFSRATRATPKRMSRVTRPTTKRPGRATRSGKVTRPTTKRPGRATRSGKVTRPTTKRPGRATRAGRVVRPGKRAKRIIPRPKIKQFQQRRLPESQPVYYVLTRKRGKLVKLYAKPLTLKDARDYLAYSVDNNLTRSAWFHPLGKSRTVVSLPNNMRGYFSRISNKLRPYKIRYGRKKRILNGYIEKSKFFKDTSGERGQLKNLRRVRTKRNSPISNSLQRQRLKNLIKSRRRLAILRRRRR